MNKELLRLQRHLIDGPGKDYPPFDKGAYRTMALSLHDLSYHAKMQEEKVLCLWMRDLANKKAEECA